MCALAIVTDSTAQITLPANSPPVYVIPLTSWFSGRSYLENDPGILASLPVTANDRLSPRLSSPTPEEIASRLLQIMQTHDQILILTVSSQLSGFFANASAAANQLRGGTMIEVIDSQTISSGLGFFVQIAAASAACGDPLPLITQKLRDTISRVYSVICVQGPSYLYYNGIIDHGQALISELLGLYPIFTIEEGKLSSLEKVRNHRYTQNIFQEFVDEFTDLKAISILQGTSPLAADFTLLNDHLHDSFPTLLPQTQSINLSLASLFGPKTCGLFLLELRAVSARTSLT